MSAIEISKPMTSTNSAGGVRVGHQYFNTSGKEIKYITFTYVPYNPVGDMVICSIKKRAEISCELTGPIQSGGEPQWISWENVWYNKTVREAKIKEVKIRYADDTEETIAGEDIVTDEDPNSQMHKLQEEKNKKEEEEEKKNKTKKAIILGAIAVVAVLLLITMMKG